MSLRWYFTIDRMPHPFMLNDVVHLPNNDISLLNISDDHIGQRFIFSSVHLNDLHDPDEVYSRGMSLKMLYVGAHNLFYDPLFHFMGDCGFDFKGLYYSENDIDVTPANVEHLSPSYPFSRTVLLKDFKNCPNPYTSPVSALVYLARTNEDVMILLKQLSVGMSWINLYSILDSVKFFFGGKEKMKKAAKITDTHLKSFCGTANNHGVLGTNARHGISGYLRPSKVMSLKEARMLIIRICRSYIQYKYNFDALKEVNNSNLRTA